MRLDDEHIPGFVLSDVDGGGARYWHHPSSGSQWSHSMSLGHLLKDSNRGGRGGVCGPLSRAIIAKIPADKRNGFQTRINTSYLHDTSIDDIPRSRIKDANTWWRHLPDCVKLALFEDYWGLNEHDGEGQAQDRL